MKAIVTGATGFIGKALCEELLKANYDVVAVIRKGSAKRGKLDDLMCLNSSLQIIEVDLEELEILHTEYHLDADVFFHLAWNGSSGADREDFDMQYSNIGYMKKAIWTAKKCGCKKVIGAGSQAEYGVVKGVANEESTVPNPFMMYGAAKLAAYQMGRLYASQLGIKLVWPRIYSVYGAGENAGTLVSYVVDTFKKGEVPQLSPCENMWNFMYITDCVRALRALSEREETEGIYNVASKDTRILKEFVAEIRNIVAPDVELNFGAKQSDPNRTFWLMPDCGKLDAIWSGAEVKFGEGIERKKMKKPLVSVCIPNYNYGHYLDHCLESVYNQTYPNLEVWVRDNHSTDKSYETALKWRRKFLDKGIYFNVIENKRNIGSDRNSKAAARGSEGDYVYTLASDDAINPEFIERCIDVFEKNPNVGTVITHREEIDENGKITQTTPFYNTDCIIDGESQATVYMMAGIAIPGQRMVRRTTSSKVAGYGRLFQVAGDWYDNFLYSLVSDVAYITEPLCQYRVHTGNETNESEKRLLGITEHYQLIHAFCDLADSFGMTMPQARYSEAIEKLGSMCLRYALKMYKNNLQNIAYRYLLLAPVYNQDITKTEQYVKLIAMKDLQGDNLKKAIKEYDEKYCLDRNVSYNPPEKHWKIDKKGCIIS